MILGIDPKVDCCFRKLFGNEGNVFLPIDLLNAVTTPPPGKLITGLQFLDPHTGMQSPDDKESVADVKAVDQAGRHYQLEMQWRVPGWFARRVLYYWGKLHPQQLRAGEHYQTLCKTACVCFLNQRLFADIPDHHLLFRLREEKHGKLFCDDLEIHTIELPKFTKSPDQLTTDLDRWCYFLKHGADLDPEALPSTLDVPIIRRAMEVLSVFTQEDHERERYERRLKAERDHGSLMQDAREEGWAIGQDEGRKEGRKEGRDEGVLWGEIRTCQLFLKQPQTPVDELAGKPRAELDAMLDQLRKQLPLNGH